LRKKRVAPDSASSVSCSASAREQRAHRPRGLDQPLRLRAGAKFHEPRRDLRQEAQVIVGFRRALERHPQQRDRVGREGGRKDGVAFDHAGIAVRGFFARRAAIDERNAEAALGEVQRDRCADNTGAEHDGIAAYHSLLLPKHLRRPRARGRLQRRRTGCRL
jgi:hypothetical protein